MKNKWLLELNQPSEGNTVGTGDACFFLEDEQGLWTGHSLLQGKKCLSSQMMFTDGLTHRAVLLLHHPRKVLSLKGVLGRSALVL